MNLSTTFFQDLMRQQNEELDAKEAKEAKQKREYKKLPDGTISIYEAQIETLQSKKPENLSEDEKKLLKHISDNKRVIAYREAKALSSTTGGNKKVKDKYTVKELKAIASRNNIKITKKLNGKTVPLNKKGLVAKLKRNKVI
jgi:3-dehydroquinate dehydratase